MSAPDVPTFTSSPLIVNSTTVTVEFSLGYNGGSDLLDIQYARDTDGYVGWSSFGLAPPLEGYTTATISGLTAPSSGSYKIRSVNAIDLAVSDAATAYQYTLNSGEYYPKVVFSSNNQYALALKYNNSASDEAAVSSDGGVTWTVITPPTGDDCYDVAISADGGYMYYETYPGGGVYQSTDHGANFTQLTNAPSAVSCMVCDSTGQKVYCPSDNDGYMYVSTDYGANFTQTHNFGFYVTWIACSANGQYVHAYNGADIYVSTDYGVTFTLTTTITQSLNISYIACDQTGQKVFLATNDGIVCSLNYGTSFIQTSHPGDICYSVSCDSLGNRVIAVASDGTTRVSYNAGTTWEVQTIIGQGLTTGYFGVSISPDGTRYVSCIGAPGTYIITRGTADVAPIWFAKPGAVYFQGSISTNNQYIVAASYHPGIGNSVVAYSSDAGATWNETSDFGYALYAMASASGQIVLTILDNDVPYLSTDYGATFTATSLSLVGIEYPDSAVVSSSGTSMLTVAGGDGYVYVSTDSGATWTSPYQFVDGYPYLACANAALDRIYVNFYPSIGGLSTTYVSTDMGTSWTALSISPSASDSNYMACDWSGQKLVLSTYSDGVYRSTDGGVTWTQTAAPTGSVNMSYISSNSTGNRIVVTDDNNNISYVSLDAGATWTILCTPGTNANSGYPDGNMISPDGSRSMITYDPLGTYFQTLGAADFPVVPCFLEGSKILCQVDGVEKYVAVETIRPGTLVKTSLHGFQPVKLIGSRVMVNMGGDNRHKDSLYLCTKENYPEITEDLTITGCHAILVDHITDAHRQGIIKTLERVFVTDKKYRLPACIDERAAVVQTAGTFTVWHFALEHADIKMNYGVYAQGLLVESSPIWHMNTKNYTLVQ